MVRPLLNGPTVRSVVSIILEKAFAGGKTVRLARFGPNTEFEACLCFPFARAHCDAFVMVSVDMCYGIARPRQIRSWLTAQGVPFETFGPDCYYIFNTYTTCSYVRSISRRMPHPNQSRAASVITGRTACVLLSIYLTLRGKYYGMHIL